MTEINLEELLSTYDTKNLTIATVCSHSSLQIFNGAKKEGFKTLGISIGEVKKFYDAFPLGKPNEFFTVDNYKDIPKYSDELRQKNVVVIPHGSFVEYLGPKNFLTLQVPTFGNRHVLMWESDREKEREWLEGAGITMPKEVKDPRNIDERSMRDHDHVFLSKLVRVFRDVLVVIDREKFVRLPQGERVIEFFDLTDRDS